MSSYKCPKCGGRKFTLTISQLADVEFDEEGDHEVCDGPYGDLEFDKESHAICCNSECRWSGSLVEATDEDREINVCRRCGSPRISYDAMVAANSDEVTAVYDNAYCHDCDGDTKNVTIKVPPGFDMESGFAPGFKKS
jgi:hypothetical protein